MFGFGDDSFRYNTKSIIYERKKYKLNSIKIKIFYSVKTLEKNAKISHSLDKIFAKHMSDKALFSKIDERITQVIEYYSALKRNALSRQERTCC